MPAEIFMRPNYDKVTQAGSYWMEKVLSEAHQRGVIVTDLPSWEANREGLEGSLLMLRAGERVLFYGVGHGSETTYTGQHRETVLDLGSAHLMQGVMVHLMSCRTGVKLGPALIEAGAAGYAGYTFDYYVLLGADTRPEAVYTQAFVEPDITFALAILEGKSLGEAYQQAIEKLEAWVEYFRKGDDPNADIMIWCLLSNRDHFLVLSPAGPVSPAKGVPLKAIVALAGVASALYFVHKKM